MSYDANPTTRSPAPDHHASAPQGRHRRRRVQRPRARRGPPPRARPGHERRHFSARLGDLGPRVPVGPEAARPVGRCRQIDGGARAATVRQAAGGAGSAALATQPLNTPCPPRSPTRTPVGRDRDRRGTNVSDGPSTAARRGSACEGQNEGEPGARGRGFSPDLSAVGLHDSAGDVEAQT